MKYIMTNENMWYNGHLVWRVEAAESTPLVKRGEKGGFIEKRNNLSQDGTCWIKKGVIITDDAMVCEDAIIGGPVTISKKALIAGESVIASVPEVRTIITDLACVDKQARLRGGNFLCDSAVITDHAMVVDSIIKENALIKDGACVITSRIYGNAVIGDTMRVCNVSCWKNLYKDLAENIRCQTGLCVFDNKVIAYKQVKRDMTSFFDKNFKYVVGKVIEVKDAEISNASCASGLHFSNANYWNRSLTFNEDTLILIAEINLKDIITVQEGKIRCSKAKIIGSYDMK